MNEDLFASDLLKGENNRGYSHLRIPVPRDAEITTLLKTWMALDEPIRRESASRISEQPYTLLAYSRRMASLVVRERNEELLLLGLLALGVDGWRFDFRDNLPNLALHYDAARRIGVDPEPIFERAAAMLYGKAADGLRTFLRRSAYDKSLEVMAFEVGADDDGFRYKYVTSFITRK
jgi:hypothetical protein